MFKKLFFTNLLLMMFGFSMAVASACDIVSPETSAPCAIEAPCAKKQTCCKDKVCCDKVKATWMKTLPCPKMKNKMLDKFFAKADCAVGVTPAQRYEAIQLRKDFFKEVNCLKHQLATKKGELVMLKHTRLAQKEMDRRAKIMEKEIKSLEKSIQKSYKNIDKDYKKILNSEQKKMYKQFKKDWKNNYCKKCCKMSACCEKDCNKCDNAKSDCCLEKKTCPLQ